MAAIWVSLPPEVQQECVADVREHRAAAASTTDAGL